jgi:hypothetical protein
MQQGTFTVFLNDLIRKLQMNYNKFTLKFSFSFDGILKIHQQFNPNP